LELPLISSIEITLNPLSVEKEYKNASYYPNIKPRWPQLFNDVILFQIGLI
jgi:hypothetical protein